MKRASINTDEFPPEYEWLLSGQRLEPLIDVAVVARLFGLRRQRVYDLIRLGELTGFRTGPRRVRITRDSLIDWVKRGGCRPAEKPWKGES